MKKKFEKDLIKEPAVDSAVEEVFKEIKHSSPYILVVKSPFEKYKKGDQIHDAEKVNAVLGSHQSHMVLKVTRKVG